MTETGLQERHYAYPLVTWGSTILGAVVALITAFMLNILGAALGVAAASFGQMGGSPMTAATVGMVWVGLSNLVALGFGAWVAGRSTANPDHHGGTLQGIAVWAVTSFVILFIAGSALSGIGGAPNMSRNLAPAMAGGDAAPSASDQTGNANAPADQTSALTAQQTEAAVKSVARATASAAFGTFLAMVLGLVAAIVGARAGARHPNWSERPRFTYVERRH